MLFLNKIAMMKNIEYLHDTVSHHLRFPNGDKVLDIDFKTREMNYLDDVLNEDWIPTLGANNDDRRQMGKYGYNVFPLCSKDWFYNLPNFIRYRIGTKSFETAVYGWYHIQCWCRSVKDCSKCKKRDVMKILKNEDFDQLLLELARDENTTIDEWTARSQIEIDSFMMSTAIENEIGETFEDL